MKKDEFLAQVDQVVGRATDEEILRFDPTLKPKLARLENHRHKLNGEVFLGNVVKRSICCEQRNIDLAADLLLFIQQKNLDIE